MAKKSSAIIVVAMQNGSLSEHTDGLVDRISRFLDRAPAKHVIFTRFIHPGEGSFFDTELNWMEMMGPPDTDIVDKLQKYPTTIIDHDTYSPFRNPDLESYLQRKKIAQVYVCGVDTNACVDSTFKELISRGYPTVLLSDLCASHSGPEYHDTALEFMHEMLRQSDNNLPATIVTSEQALS